MTKEEFLQFHRDTCDQLFKLTKAKNSDYTGNGGPFANFEQVEHLGVCSTEAGILTRMLDKMARLSSFLQKGSLEVKNESAIDSAKDLANYAIILAAYMQSKKDPNEEFKGFEIID
jgi:hypothetical protein